MSDVAGDGDGIPMTTAASSWGDASRRSEWLNFVSHGAGLWLLQLERVYAPAFSSRTGGYGLSGLCTLGGNQLSCE